MKPTRTINKKKCW